MSTTIAKRLDNSTASIASAPTPLLVVNGEKAQGNIQRMADYCHQHELVYRPHTKTHKSKQVAKLQLAAGGSGLTVAKVGEARIMAEVCDNLLIAYPTVDHARCVEVADLAHDVRLMVAVDSTVAVDALAGAAQRAGSTIGILVDLDVGVGRTGLQSIPDTVALARRVHQASSLRLDGLFCYPGHILGTVAEQTPKLRQLSEFLKEAMDQWKQQGLPCETVSSGTSPTAFQSHLVPELTEIRPGTNIFNDLNLTYGGYCQMEDCAARIITTVVSNAVPDQIVLDAGSKTLSSDLCGPAPHSGHGYIVEFPEAKIKRLTEEHAQVDVSACDHRPVIGERVSVIPNHICVCVNLQDRIWWQESGSAPEIQAWNVDARGKLS